MTHPILDIVLFVLFMFGYILTIMSIELFHKHGKRSYKFFKNWFFLSQGAALLIVLYMMTTERNQIPVIGYVFLLAINFLYGMLALSAVVIPPKERNHTGKKLLKLSKWILCSGLVLTVVWAMIWCKEIFISRWS